MVLGCSSSAFAGATIQIINTDGAGEGFNDPTPVAPVGGNPGTTLGQQRLIAFQHAADIWGATLDSNQIIRIQAAFNPLGVGVLGSAGSIQAFRDFGGVGSYPGAEFPGTWYGGALANKRAGADLNPAVNDINAQFSSNFNFLGLDNSTVRYPTLWLCFCTSLATVLTFKPSSIPPRCEFRSRPGNSRGFPDIFGRRILIPPLAYITTR